MVNFHLVRLEPVELEELELLPYQAAVELVAVEQLAAVYPSLLLGRMLPVLLLAADQLDYGRNAAPYEHPVHSCCMAQCSE